jgi:hypothetical protein
MSPPPFWRRLYTVRPLAALVLIVFWFALFAAHRGHIAVAAIIGLAATGTTILTVRRGDHLAERQRQKLAQALEAADARNRELDKLRHLGGTLLSGKSLADLQQEVALAAAELLEAESGTVTIVVEEGRFLKVVAASGALAMSRGKLLPVDHSLLGWVVTHDQPLVANDVDNDPRSHHDPTLPGPLTTAAIAPLRASGVVVGTVAAKVSGLPATPGRIAAIAFVPCCPRRQDPVVATPSAPVTAGPPVIAPFPEVTSNVTGTPGTGRPPSPCARTGGPTAAHRLRSKSRLRECQGVRGRRGNHQLEAAPVVGVGRIGNDARAGQRDAHAAERSGGRIIRHHLTADRLERRVAGSALRLPRDGRGKRNDGRQQQRRPRHPRSIARRSQE